MYKHQLHIANSHTLYSNQAEAFAVLLEAGANLNSVANGYTLLDGAARFGYHRIITAIATTPGIMLNAQVIYDIFLWSLIYKSVNK